MTFEHNTKESKKISNIVTRESIPGWGRNQVPLLSQSRAPFTGDLRDQGSRKAEHQQVCGKRESEGLNRRPDHAALSKPGKDSEFYPF